MYIHDSPGKGSRKRSEDIKQSKSIILLQYNLVNFCFSLFVCGSSIQSFMVTYVQFVREMSLIAKKYSMYLQFETLQGFIIPIIILYSPFTLRCYTVQSIVRTGQRSRYSEIYLTCPDRPRDKSSLLYNGYQICFLKGKAAGAWH